LKLIHYYYKSLSDYIYAVSLFGNIIMQLEVM